MRTYLEGLWLRKNDTVILDLTCNFAIVVSHNTEDKILFTTGHWVGGGGFFDSEGRKVGVPNPTSIGNLINRIARVTDAMRWSGNLVINLAPLPRY